MGKIKTEIVNQISKEFFVVFYCLIEFVINSKFKKKKKQSVATFFITV